MTELSPRRVVPRVVSRRCLLICTMSPEDFRRVTARRVASSLLQGEERGIEPGACGASGHDAGEERYCHLVSV